jgi:hypothetical protein
LEAAALSLRAKPPPYLTSRGSANDGSPANNVCGTKPGRCSTPENEGLIEVVDSVNAGVADTAMSAAPTSAPRDRFAKRRVFMEASVHPSLPLTLTRASVNDA